MSFENCVYWEKERRTCQILFILFIEEQLKEIAFGKFDCLCCTIAPSNLPRNNFKIKLNQIT